MPIEVVHGTFGAGKTQAAVEQLRAVGGAMGVVPNKALKMALLQRLDQGGTATVLTLDSLVNRCVRDRADLRPQDYEGKRRAFCQLPTVPAYLLRRQRPTLLVVDDADRLPEPVLSCLARLAAQLRIQLMLTVRDARVVESARLEVHTWRRLPECRRCPAAAQRLLQVLFRPDTLPAAHRLPPDAAVTLHPHAGTANDGAALQCAQAVRDCLGWATPGDDPDDPEVEPDGDAPDGDAPDGAAPWLPTAVLVRPGRVMQALEMVLLEWSRRHRRTYRVYRSVNGAGMTDLVEDVVVCAPEAFYGLERARVVAIVDGCTDAALLEALTRAQQRLHVFFAAAHPPLRFSRVCHALAPTLDPRGTLFVNWEGYARPRAKPTAPPTTTPSASTVSVRRVADELVTQGLHDGTGAGVLCALAKQAGWAAPPTLTSVCVHHQLPLPDIIHDNDLHCQLGLAAELLLQRQLMFLDPPAALIPPPVVYYSYRRARAAPSPEFAATWAARPDLRDRQQDTAAWLREFRAPQWGDRGKCEDMAVWLGRPDAVTPHIVLAERLLHPDVQAQVAWAAQAYADMGTRVLEARALWLLASLELVVHGGHSRLLPVLSACDGVGWARGISDAQQPVYDDLFVYMGERLTHFLQLLGVTSMDAQLPVADVGVGPGRTARGFCDFVATTPQGERVIELKASTGEWDHRWAVQAALYARGLGLPVAHVYNVLNGEHRVVHVPVDRVEK